MFLSDDRIRVSGRVERGLHLAIRSKPHTFRWRYEHSRVDAQGVSRGTDGRRYGSSYDSAHAAPLFWKSRRANAWRLSSDCKSS